MLVDTHCHLHIKDYKLDAEEEIAAAKKAGVNKIILVGEDAADSILAIEKSSNDPDLFAAVGLHPHFAKNKADLDKLESLLDSRKVVAVGECGLDYWYGQSSVADQKSALIYQIRLAQKYNLPLSLHLRSSKDGKLDAFVDFFKIFDDFAGSGKKPRGVVHSFTSGHNDLQGVLSRGLYVGLNGIVTFGDSVIQEVIKSIPLESMLVETDTPYLTPVPERGKINAPKYMVLTVEYIAKQLGLSFDEVAKVTSDNANRLFNLEV